MQRLLELTSPQDVHEESLASSIMQPHRTVLPESRSSDKRLQRFAFIDGLRGLAALAVFFEHSGRVLLKINHQEISAFFLSLGRWGHLGVDVFFVLSGFVIALTLSNARITPSYFFRFMGRRALRLDPPYWLAIALTCVTATLMPGSLRRLAPGVFSTGQVVAHLFYLQRILGYPQLNIVFWTLCIEVQFYLGICALLGLLQRGRNADQVRRLWAAACGALFVAALLWPAELLPKAPFAATLLPYLSEFLAGSLVWWVSARAIPATPVRIALVAMAWIAAFSGEAEAVTAALTALVIDLARERGRLTSWLSGRPWQFLGRISYSLYLTHISACVAVAKLVSRFVPAGRLLANMWIFLAMLAASVGTATLFHFLIEAPALRLHHRLPRNSPEQGGPLSAARAR